MTKQQVKHLKTLLDSSAVEESSKELDEKILRAANAQIEQNRRDKTQKNRSLLIFRSRGTFGAAALSVVLTIGCFWGLSQLFKADEAYAPLVIRSEKVKIDVVEGSNVATPKELIIDDTHQLNNPLDVPESADARDLILADMDLPRTQDLLSSIYVEQASDRVFMHNNIIAAMDDIRDMLNGGRLDKARQRYEELRQLCDGCRLPESLEALVLNGQTAADSG